MKLLLCLFLLSAVTADPSSQSKDNCLKDVIYLTKLIKSIASKVVEKTKLVCVNVHQRGSYATCPPGYITTGCSCGFGCGSWDIQHHVTCHCQCARMDWTSARCCKMASV